MIGNTNAIIIKQDYVRKVSDFASFTPLYSGEIVQYTGETNSQYTNGYFYKQTTDTIKGFVELKSGQAALDMALDCPPQSYCYYNIFLDVKNENLKSLFSDDTTKNASLYFEQYELGASSSTAVLNIEHDDSNYNAEYPNKLTDDAKIIFYGVDGTGTTLTNSQLESQYGIYIRMGELATNDDKIPTVNGETILLSYSDEDKTITAISQVNVQPASTIDVSGKEDKSNKVTAISASSTDDEYASAKATYNAINTKVVAQIIRH